LINLTLILDTAFRIDISSILSLPLSCTHTHTHKHTHTHSLSLYHIHSHTTHLHNNSLSLSHTQTHILSQTVTTITINFVLYFSILYLKHTHTHTHIISLFHIHIYSVAYFTVFGMRRRVQSIRMSLINCLINVLFTAVFPLAHSSFTFHVTNVTLKLFCLSTIVSHIMMILSAPTTSTSRVFTFSEHIVIFVKNFVANINLQVTFFSKSKIQMIF
jgi:hypothetical protein